MSPEKKNEVALLELNATLKAKEDDIPRKWSSQKYTEIIADKLEVVECESCNEWYHIEHRTNHKTSWNCLKCYPVQKAKIEKIQ